MKRKFLDQIDYGLIAGNFTTIQTFINFSTDTMSSLLSRVGSVENVGGGLSAWAGGINTSVSSILSRLTTAEGNITSMLSRLSTAEGSITSLLSRVTTAESTIGSHTTDINALKAWRAAKATASPDVSTSFSVATDVITLGLAAPRASSINSIISTIMGEINGIKAILRSREILAT